MANYKKGGIVERELARVRAQSAKSAPSKKAAPKKKAPKTLRGKIADRNKRLSDL